MPAKISGEILQCWDARNSRHIKPLSVPFPLHFLIEFFLPPPRLLARIKAISRPWLLLTIDNAHTINTINTLATLCFSHAPPCGTRAFKSVWDMVSRGKDFSFPHKILVFILILILQVVKLRFCVVKFLKNVYRSFSCHSLKLLLRKFEKDLICPLRVYVFLIFNINIISLILRIGRVPNSKMEVVGVATWL